MGTVLVTERDNLGVVVIEVRGDVGSTAAAELRAALVRAIRHTGPVRLVIDLRDAGHIEPEGIGAVVASADVASDSGVAMTVRDAAPEVAEELLVAGLPRAQVTTAAPV
ncbi:STAS domain-containing protein [Asanoa sp. WMMD1127]|uniref:STAS domain-containing protein n=1 Tax=Asanoa sp. WMMD1127 TaxID=3016107 RepID=UPI002415CA91|nr:STAS domain-containing protein [Asanoa sp. WMMD1127]MDG4823181.1 STAS domain-containing protein [Asanoa sp. WMMD1127]